MTAWIRNPNFIKWLPTIGAIAILAHTGCAPVQSSSSTLTNYCKVQTESQTSPDGTGTGWTTVDDFQYSAGVTSLPTGMTADTSGVLYVSGAGYTREGGTPIWVVRKSSDNGQSWSIVDQYDTAANGTGQGAYPRAILASNSKVQAIGVSYTSSGGTAGILRSTADQGSTWTQVGMTGLMGVGFTGYFGQKLIFHTPSQKLFADGNPSTTDPGHGWLVSSSPTAGELWTKIDDYTYAGGTSSTIRDIRQDSSGNIYVVGHADDGNTSTARYMHWIVRKSADNGSTWTTVDDFQLSGYSAEAHQMLVAQDSSLYVAGVAYGIPKSTGGTTQYWLVRKSTDQGATWTTVDQWELSDLAYPSAAAQDTSGKLYFAAEQTLLTDVTYTENRVMIRSSSNGSSWSVENLYSRASQCSQPGAGMASRPATPTQMIVAPNGSLYLTIYAGDGYVNGNSAVGHWIVRKK